MPIPLKLRLWAMNFAVVNYRRLLYLHRPTPWSVKTWLLLTTIKILSNLDRFE